MFDPKPVQAPAVPRQRKKARAHRRTSTSPPSNGCRLCGLASYQNELRPPSARRPWRRHLVRVVIAPTAFAVLAAGTATALVPTTRLMSYPVANVVAIVVSPTTVGFSDGDLFGMTPAEIQANLALVQSTGSDTIRIDIPWAAVEPANGTYDWTQIDDIVDAASADGIAVDAVLNDTPAWAATPGTPALSGPPASDAQFASFASAVATRYDGQISAYEIWNEPNSVQNWSTGPNAAAYTALLKAAYPAIKAADPSATVVAGVVGSTVTYGNITENPVNFVSQMYTDGAEGYFDALSFHPYSYTQEFSQGTTTANSPIEQLTAIRQLMVANGDSTKLIWATEYGLPTSTVSQQTQASYISNFLNTWSGLSYVGPSFIYTLQDTTATNTLDPSDTFGVFNVNGTPTPAELVIAAFIAAHPTTTAVDPPADPPVTPPAVSLAASVAAAYQQAVQAYVTAYLNAIAAALASIGKSPAAAVAPTVAPTATVAAVKAVSLVTPTVAPAAVVKPSAPPPPVAITAAPAVVHAAVPALAPATASSPPSTGSAVSSAAASEKSTAASGVASAKKSTALAAPKRPMAANRHMKP
jgi:polysaccharide biosynthesis protein PslG